MKRLFTWIFLLLCLLFVFNTRTANAQKSDNRRLLWQRYDVTIDNMDTANNRFDVTESYTLDIQRGPFRFGTASIPMDRLTDINSLRVSQDGTPFRESCLKQVGTYCQTEENGQFSFSYYFLEPANTGDTLHIQLSYRVLGALRSYADGDEIYWAVIPSDRPFPIMASTIIIHMPTNRPPKRVVSYPDTWEQKIKGNIVTWTSPRGGLSSQDKFEVRVEYMHDPAMQAPAWQHRKWNVV